MQKIFGLLLFSALLLSCATETSYKVSNNLTSPYVNDDDNSHLDNKTLVNTLNQVLAQRIKKANLMAVASGGYVLLVGQVVNKDDTHAAESLCLSYPAVKKVFNYLQVNSSPELNLNDNITEQVRNRLARQFDINSKNLAVIGVDNVVYIIGTDVGNLTTLENTINQGIYSIAGVAQVINLVEPGSLDYRVN